MIPSVQRAHMELKPLISILFDRSWNSIQYHILMLTFNHSHVAGGSFHIHSQPLRGWKECESLITDSQLSVAARTRLSYAWVDKPDTTAAES
eukprot:6180572-Pleurochrysis_carterae.AAC.1